MFIYLNNKEGLVKYPIERFVENRLSITSFMKTQYTSCDATIDVESMSLISELDDEILVSGKTDDSGVEMVVYWTNRHTHLIDKVINITSVFAFILLFAFMDSSLFFHQTMLCASCSQLVLIILKINSDWCPILAVYSIVASLNSTISCIYGIFKCSKLLFSLSTALSANVSQSLHSYDKQLTSLVSLQAYNVKWDITTFVLYIVLGLIVFEVEMAVRFVVAIRARHRGYENPRKMLEFDNEKLLRQDALDERTPLDESIEHIVSILFGMFGSTRDTVKLGDVESRSGDIC